MLHASAFVVTRHVTRQRRTEAFDLMALHDGGVVRIRHHRVLRGGFVRVADHAKQTVRLGLAVDDEVGVENFVSTVFAVGLRKHHQLGIGGVAFEPRESRQQIINFILSQCQAVIGIRLHQGLFALLQYVHMHHVSRRQGLQ